MLINFIKRQQEWSAKTFGRGVRTKGITAHIRKELVEIEAAPHDLSEWIDVVILALDGAWRAGHSPEEIVAALEAKQFINFTRTYLMPESDDVPGEHVRLFDTGNEKVCVRQARIGQFSSCSGSLGSVSPALARFLLGVSRGRIYQLISSGRIKSFGYLGFRLISLSSLLEYAKECNKPKASQSCYGKP